VGIEPPRTRCRSAYGSELIRGVTRREPGPSRALPMVLVAPRSGPLRSCEKTRPSSRGTDAVPFTASLTHDEQDPPKAGLLNRHVVRQTYVTLRINVLSSGSCFTIVMR
jgi:hypothetical protein